ncbi:hypothetical protein EG327_011716 [Venturia inaequalis]|uniref:Uncharacterized protein n=1 Tax=Venturia inaequalis TaxID=5025 RepID=A0A8H3VR07_VENIN|nr:hypothetical protein EG327_011716 [Venturia inaequalis]
MAQLTVFQKHLLNLTLQKATIITPYESLRGFLSLGFDFPVALVSSIALPFVYGNTGFLSHKIDVTKIPRCKQPTQLESVSISTGKKGFTRREVLELVDSEYQRGGSELGMVKRLFDRIHLLGVWVIGARTQGRGKGMVDGKTLEAFMKGGFFEIVRERRRDRGDVLPLWRGGPISVAGHSWFVRKLFGVHVYLKDPKAS